MEFTPIRALFNPDEELKPLRRPKTHRPTPAAGNFTLSINAAEFVPRVATTITNVQESLQKYQQPTQQSSRDHNSQMEALSSSSVQDRLHIANHSASCGNEGDSCLHQKPQQRANGSQHDAQQFQQQPSTTSALAECAHDMENAASGYLQTVIECLDKNPGHFDSIASRFNHIFEGMESNQFLLSIAMEDIFDASIRNANFRYMGAKLYGLLYALNPSKDSLFHSMLKCKLDFHQQQVREFKQQKQEGRVRETALFLAELYMQLRGEDSCNSLIAENIVFSLKELLSMEDYSKENLRCICLTLKLAGYDLSTDCPSDMRYIITKLAAINLQNPGKYPLANSVIALQKNNWGRKTNDLATPVETHRTQQTLRASDDPVFYGPDGHEITAEECEFLSSGAAYINNSSDNEEDSDDADVDLDPEMDEETERDFKLFLKQANNK